MKPDLVNTNAVQIIPVLDILDGTVVRGVGGHRDQYRPIVSQLTNSAEPLAVARAIRDRFGAAYVYVADLDGIRQDAPNLQLVSELREAGFELMIDAGSNTTDQIRRLLELGATDVVVPLERLRDPNVLAEAARQWPGQITFSLDLQSGSPLLPADSDWQELRAAEIADRAVAAGITRLIALDLAAVGSNAGPSTLDLCRAIRRGHPGVKLITGGGVRGPADLANVAAAGIDAVLIASALHDGRF